MEYIYTPKWGNNREKPKEERITAGIMPATDGQISEYGRMSMTTERNGFRPKKAKGDDEIRHEQVKNHVGKINNLNNPLTGKTIKDGAALVKENSGFLMLKIELVDAAIDISTLSEGLEKNL